MKTKSKMTLLIADDDIAFRMRLASIISNIDGIDVVGTAGNALDTISAAKKTRPDVIILDLHMPGGSGFEVLHAIKSSKPCPTVVMLTVSSKSEYQTMSYLAGADYFFEKSSELMKMIRMFENSVKEPITNGSQIK